MWSNRILVLGAAAVGATAMMVGPTAAPAGADPCAPMAGPTPGCMPPNTVGAPEGAGVQDGADNPPVGDPVSAELCAPDVAPTPGCTPPGTPPPDTAAMAQTGPPPNPCNDSGYFMSNIAICMNPQIVGEAQPAA
jgi:hypothetical protein